MGTKKKVHSKNGAVRRTSSPTEEGIKKGGMSESDEKGVKLESIAPSTKKHMVKPRPGFEPMAELLSNVARSHADAIGTEGIDLGQLAADLAASAALAQPCRDASAKLQKLEETRFIHRSNAWAQTLTLLDRARSAGRTNPDILRAIAEVDAFLKHKKKKAEPPAPSVQPPAVA